jgi:hypothetical protein
MAIGQSRSASCVDEKTQIQALDREPEVFSMHAAYMQTHT